MHRPDLLPTVDFLIRAAREFRRGGWVFTGFHWPVLAGQFAHSLDGEEFCQVFEAGATTDGPGRSVPTSTTDFAAYDNALGLRRDSATALFALVRRLDRVVLDAGNVDLSGCVNSSMIGDRRRPSVRLPGGGGAADAAAAAKELVWLHGGSDVSRIQQRVEHVTAAPGPSAVVRLHTRWGIVRLGDGPQLEERSDGAEPDAFVRHLATLGVEVDGAAERPAPTDEERRLAVAFLEEAAGRGYVVAQRALREVARA
jgi:glutaconate CoA-transferase subunit B